MKSQMQEQHPGTLRRRRDSHPHRWIVASILLTLFFLIAGAIFIIFNIQGIIHVPWFNNWFTVFVVVLIPVICAATPLLQWLHTIISEHPGPSPNASHHTTTPPASTGAPLSTLQTSGTASAQTSLPEHSSVVLNTAPAVTGQQMRHINDGLEPGPRRFHREEWGEAPTNQIYGRDKERNKLEQWVIEDRCRMVGVFGIGGIGKTALIATVARQVSEPFDVILWCTLKEAPPLESIVERCNLLIPNPLWDISLKEASEQALQLLKYLQSYRCMIILDNVEMIMQEGSRGGQWRNGYEGYGKLLQLLGETEHQSCLLLTSREKPQEVALLEGNASPVRSLQLLGLGYQDGQSLLQDKGLFGTDESWRAFVQQYAGNPLSLKLAAGSIREIFRGDIAAFLKEGEALLVNIYELINHQFKRLSALEQEIMYWLAIEREAISLEALFEDMIQRVSKREILAALESLRRRSMIETNDTALFTLQPVIMEFVTHALIEQVHREICEQRIQVLASHALIKAQIKYYVRESQVRVILKPLADTLLSTLGRDTCEAKLRAILLLLRKEDSLSMSYAAGNVLNLLIQSGYHLRNYDFSHLIIRQAYLRNIELPGVNFAHATITTSVFADTFGSILSVAFSKKGDLLAAGTADNEVRLWRIEGGIPLYTWRKHKDWVQCVAFSFDDKLIASASEDGTICIWEVGSGRCLKVLHGGSGWLFSVAFSPDGSMLVSGGDDQAVRLWDVQNGTCLKVLPGHTSRVYSVAFSPEGNIIASGGKDRTVRLWDVSTGQCVKILAGHTDWVHTIAFDSQGRFLASAGFDQTVRLWDVRSGDCIRVLTGHTSRVYSVAFSPDGRLVVSGGRDQIVRIWELENEGEEQIFRALPGHTVSVHSVAFSPDGRTLASGGEDQAVRLWEMAGADKDRCSMILQGHSDQVYSVGFNSDGQTLASCGEDGKIRLWDARTGASSILQSLGHRSWAVAFSPDGRTLASASNNHNLRLWEVNTGRLLKELEGHTSWVWAVAFSPNGETIATCADDQTVRLWNIESGKCFKFLEGYEGVMWSLSFSPDGSLVACGGQDEFVRIWEVESGQCCKKLQGVTSIWTVEFNPDRKTLAGGCDDGTIKFWDLQTGECLKTLSGHDGRVMKITFGPDGSTFASCGQDGAVRLWKIDQDGDYRCLQTQPGHTKRVWFTAFSPDGGTLASCSDDGTIKIWDVQTGQCLKILRGDRPYEGMNITGIKGLTDAQKASLRALGAVENEECAHA